MNNNVLIFKPISGTWLQINPRAGESAQTLAAKLSELGITIDENAQFCRIIKYYDTYKETITYSTYFNQKIIITIQIYSYV